MMPGRKKLKIIVILGENNVLFSETIFRVLSKYFKTKEIQKKLGFSDFLKDVLVIKPKAEKLNSFESLIKKSGKSILVLTPSEEYNLEEIDRIKKDFNFLVFCSDSKDLKNGMRKSEAEILTFGFKETADFQATDIKQEENLNFKLNHRGNIIPFWLKGTVENKNIYSALAVSAIGEILGINLIKVSEVLKS